MEIKAIFRVDSEEFETFKGKVQKSGKNFSQFMREVVSAYNDDRLRITPTDDQAESFKIYEKGN